MTATFTPSHRGGSGSPMVCLHGFTDTWRTWERRLLSRSQRLQHLRQLRSVFRPQRRRTRDIADIEDLAAANG